MSIVFAGQNVAIKEVSDKVWLVSFAQYDRNNRIIEVGWRVQHVAAAAGSPASDRKIYVVWIGVIWAAILAGFGLDFARYLSGGPPPPFILHVHAAVFVLWLGLVTLQILWVEIGNLRRHKQLGWVTVAVSVWWFPRPSRSPPRAAGLS